MSGSRTHNLLIVCTIPDGTRLATIPRRGLLPKGAASMRTGAALALVLIALLASPVGAVTVKIDDFPIPTTARSPRRRTADECSETMIRASIDNHLRRSTT